MTTLHLYWATGPNKHKVSQHPDIVSAHQELSGIISERHSVTGDVHSGRILYHDPYGDIRETATYEIREI